MSNSTGYSVAADVHGFVSRMTFFRDGIRLIKKPEETVSLYLKNLYRY